MTNRTSELPWFRLWIEFMDDPVVQSLSFEDQRHFVIAMCMKRRGMLDKDYPTPQVRLRVICKGLGLDAAAAGEANRRIREVGLVDEAWHPIKWAKRQPVSDSNAADRKRAQRERERQMSQDVTVTGRDSHSLELEEESERESERESEPADGITQYLPLEAAQSRGQPGERSDPEAEPERRGQTAIAKTAETPKTGKVGSRLGDFPLTPERRKVALQQGIPESEVAREHQLFTNHWRAKTGRDATKLDWDGTWQNWCIKSGRDFRSRSVPRGKPAEPERSHKEFPS